MVSCVKSPQYWNLELAASLSVGSPLLLPKKRSSRPKSEKNGELMRQQPGVFAAKWRGLIFVSLLSSLFHHSFVTFICFVCSKKGFGEWFGAYGWVHACPLWLQSGFCEPSPQWQRNPNHGGQAQPRVV